VNSGATHHTTPSVSNISTLRPLASFNPSSIIVGNGFSLPITSVGDSVLPGPFYLNNILLAPGMVQSEGPEKATRGGVNGSQSKFLTGIWPMSQSQPESALF
jgi:hypothetical protein